MTGVRRIPDPATLAALVTGRTRSLFADDLDTQAAALRDRVRGASVLVIGGAGTIGASFIRTLIAFEPARVIVLDLNENGLAELVRDLRSFHGLRVPETFVTYPVGFSDVVAARIMAHHGPFDIVANFAAHKHVRSEKDVYSIEAMFENNVFRAQVLLERLLASPPRHFFSVSTDKAADPANLMGASKKLMEQVLMAHAHQLPVTTARFANVAWSGGSLPDGFLHRLARGQPLSAPRGVRRWFVSAAEAGEICLLACMLGEPGDIFIPRLDVATEPLGFDAIAVRLLHLLGLQPRECASEEEARALAAARTPDSCDYPVYFFGSDTSGEKPEEIFVGTGESARKSSLSSLDIVAGHRPALAEVRETLAALQRCFGRPQVQKADVVAALASRLPGFRHLETHRNLDERM